MVSRTWLTIVKRQIRTRGKVLSTLIRRSWLRFIRAAMTNNSGLLNQSMVTGEGRNVIYSDWSGTWLNVWMFWEGDDDEWPLEVLWVTPYSQLEMAMWGQTRTIEMVVDSG
ncbi:hypothetical protein L1987_01875 [Smallanthus sonchifolius]|uniref:Uncharacterized protein n=1 Tax=Smallanthus sonchifolius TaxID=185202 RepID=A0ACB9K663_9ASTR|nr:hypothetical protein L1987_01875 [Smallanthus sonchifolius]